MILYGLKNCDTCRKALKYLPDVEFVDVRGQGVPGNVLARALTQFGTKLVNTRSTTWRELSRAQQDLPQLELLQAYPALMKRPLITDLVAGQEQMWLGWTSDIQAALGAG
ncbi:MAG: arsenate reductase [Rhodobacteraceae bacterium]|nr:arsenate reductase [Paracoccaceae bacterium]